MPVEEEWTGDLIPILADPDKPYKYLSMEKGKYTDDINFAKRARSNFLNTTEGRGICTQGSGRLMNNGGVITCTRKNQKVFEWETGLLNFIPFHTVARNSGSDKLSTGNTIRIDAPWLIDEFLARRGNNDGIFIVTDVGGGLARDATHESLDIYMGEGNAAYKDWKDFMVIDNKYEYKNRGGPWWPVYLVRYFGWLA